MCLREWTGGGMTGVTKCEDIFDSYQSVCSAELIEQSLNDNKRLYFALVDLKESI
jgi:hypothetical protein